MEKLKILILAIIFTIISIIYVLISYYGFDRYFYMHMFNTHKYLSKYKNLPKYGDGKVVVGFQVKPTDNLEKIKPMLNSILDQTIRVDVIYVVCDIVLPTFINDIAVKIPWKNNNTNPIIPLLLKEKDNDTVIIWLNTDVVYGKDYIETMIDKSKNGSCIVNDKNGLLIKPSFYDYSIIRDGEIDKNMLLSKSNGCTIVDNKCEETYQRM
jgi:hypothetical protein